MVYLNFGVRKHGKVNFRDVQRLLGVFELSGNVKFAKGVLLDCVKVHLVEIPDGARYDVKLPVLLICFLS